MDKLLVCGKIGIWGWDKTVTGEGVQTARDFPLVL